MGTLFLRGGDLPQAKRIVFVGDSITDNGLYIAFMEAYFLQHMPERELTFVNLGVAAKRYRASVKKPIHGRVLACMTGLSECFERASPIGSYSSTV